MPGQQQSQTAAMNALLKNTKGGYKKVRQQEAKAKGFSSLPGGLQDMIGKVVATKFQMRGGKKPCPQFMIQAVVSGQLVQDDNGSIAYGPGQFRGRKISRFYNIIESRRPDGSLYKTANDKLEDLTNDLQLLGVELPETEQELPDTLASSQGIYFWFNTWKPDQGETQMFIQRSLTDEELQAHEDGKPPMEAVEEEHTPDEAEASGGEVPANPYESAIGEMVTVTDEDGTEWTGILENVDTEDEKAEVHYKEEDTTYEVALSQLTF